MSLPLSFLLGLLALFVAVEFERPVPGSGSLEAALVLAPLLLLPTLLVALARRSLGERLVHGRRGLVPPRVWLRASCFAVPAVVWVLFTMGGLADVVDRLSGDSEALRIVILLAPLVLMDAPRVVADAVVVQWREIDDDLQGRSIVSRSMLPQLADTWPFARLRLGWIALLVMPCLLFGVALDVLSTWPQLQGMVLITGFGSTAAMLVFLLAAALALPTWFRLAFAVRPLPEPLGERLRATASRLGFPERRLFMLSTGQRSLNAMMVGPLPRTHSLGITDGLIRVLGDDALAGVVAHEVGHARRGHPALLLTLAVVVPLLLLAPLHLLELQELPATVQVLLGVGAATVGWIVVRSIAHRFEHEADVVSVQAFGAAPCSQALRRVVELAVPTTHGFVGRASSLHPDERHRYEVMWRYERDPAFRARFDRAGRRLRTTIAGLVLGAFVAAVFAWSREWPFERAFVAFHRGDLVTAREHISGVDEPVPPRWREAWQRLRDDFAAAAAIAPQARDWPSVELEVVTTAWSRGVETLLREGPAAASSWMSIAVGVDRDPPLVRRTILDYCRAAAAGDTERMEHAHLVVRRLGAPDELQRVFTQ